MAERKELHIVSKEIVAHFGSDIIQNKQFLYLLADYGAFKDIPATKQILNDLYKQGFGDFLWNLLQSGDAHFLEKCHTHRMEFLSEGKYRQDVTEYVYASLLYALGLIRDVSEPQVSNPFSAEAKNSPIGHTHYTPKVNLRLVLEKLQQEYMDLLKQIVVPADNGDGVASGYFEFDTLVQMFVVEEKIRLINQRLNRSDDFCQREKQKVLNAHNTDMQGQQVKLLEVLKKQYVATFDAYHCPTGRQWTGYFDDETKNKQESLDEQIKFLLRCLKEDTDWCSYELKKFLKKCANSEKRRKYIFIGAASAVAIFVITCVMGVASYSSSSDARAQFDKTYALGESALKEQEFFKAMSKFKEAEDGYNASWISWSYKRKAHKAAVNAALRIFAPVAAQIEDELKTGHVIEACVKFKAIPTNLILDGSSEKRYYSIKLLLDQKIDSAVEEELKGILSEIYKSGGKLSSSTQKRVDQIYSIKPDNYWLNFIRNKHNE